MARILLVDEDAKKLNILSTLLKTEGYRVVPILGLEKSPAFVKAQQFDLMVFDISADSDAGIGIVLQSRENRPEARILVLFDSTAREKAETLNELPMCQLVEKPFKPGELLSRIQRAVDFGGTQTDSTHQHEKTTIKLIDGDNDFIAYSPAMQSAREMIKRVAMTEIPIMITGEKGVDKEQIAKAVHAGSNRRIGKLISLDCAELNEKELDNLLWVNEKESVFTEAGGGTLFLNNIEAMPSTVQAKLAAVIESKQVEYTGNKNKVPIDVRFITGTSINLRKAAEKGSFDTTLLKHIALMPITIKPLRERVEDIVPTAEKLMKARLGDACPENVFDDETQKIFTYYLWPGNVREMQEVVDKLADNLKDGVVTKADLPPELVYAGEAAMARQQNKNTR